MSHGFSAHVRSLNRVRVDQLVAVAVLVEMELQTWLGGSIHDPAYAGLAGFVLAGAVAVRRRHPLGAGFVVLPICLGSGNTLPNSAGMIVCVPLLFYGLGAFASERRSVRMLAFAFVIAVLNALRKPHGGLSAVAPVAVFAILSPYVLGRMVRAQGARAREARDVAE